MFDFSLIFLNIESSIHCLLSWRKVFWFFFSVSPVSPFLLPRIQWQQGTCSPACPPQANWFLVSWVAGDCGTVWQRSQRGLCSILSRGSPEIFKVAERNDVKLKRDQTVLLSLQQWFTARHGESCRFYKGKLFSAWLFTPVRLHKREGCFQSKDRKRYKQ